MVKNKSTKEKPYFFNGPVFGYQISSYPSELYGTLSLQIFLSIIVKHYSLSVTFMEIRLSDNATFVGIYNDNSILLENFLRDPPKK